MPTIDFGGNRSSETTAPGWFFRAITRSKGMSLGCRNFPKTSAARQRTPQSASFASFRNNGKSASSRYSARAVTADDRVGRPRLWVSSCKKVMVLWLAAFPHDFDGVVPYLGTWVLGQTSLRAKWHLETGIRAKITDGRAPNYWRRVAKEPVKAQHPLRAANPAMAFSASHRGCQGSSGIGCRPAQDQAGLGRPGICPTPSRPLRQPRPQGQR